MIRRSSFLDRCLLWLAVCIGFAGCSQNEPLYIDLDSNWTFSEAGKQEWLSASVPGCIHTDLLGHQKIEDPFYRKNELAVKWVEQKDWIYRTPFVADKNIMARENVEICFDGLDTYADVYINDSLLFKADNMFIAWNWPLKALLKEGKNELRIYFHSAVKVGMEKLLKVPYTLLAANELAPENERTNVYTRKAPFHYGWDWGPRLVTCGIWKPVRIIGWNDAKLEDVYFKPVRINDNEASYSAQLDITAGDPVKVDLRLSIDGIQRATVSDVELTTGQNRVDVDFTIEKPELWWTNGLGSQKLYEADVSVMKSGKLLGNIKKKIGVRTLELVREPDSVGHTFYFRLNGVPVFMKGANYIPSDIFTTRNILENYQRVVKDAVDANMNMLRFWGGAIYENDELYDLLDEKGILAWNDFMFACNMQPDDSMHLENIRKEAEYNVKRLRNHPSVALWCGNNENLIAWFTWNWKDRFEPEVSEALWGVYQKIYYDILPSAVLKHHPEISYWPSSPQSEGNQLADRKSGDEHDWTVWFADAPFSNFSVNVPRFVSEYGMQSFPEMKTIRAFANDSDMSYRSSVMEHRQRSNLNWIGPGVNGNEMILRYIRKYYDEPKDFNSFIYLSQVMQAEGMRMAIESHRRSMPHCMGSLYWQINDCWPTMSWSGVDYFGRWKALHYFVRDAFEPLIVVPFTDGKNISVSIVSDLLKDTSAMLEMRLYDFRGTELWRYDLKIDVISNSSRVYYSVPSIELTGKGNAAGLVLEARLSTGDETIASNLFYFAEPRDLDFKKPVIEKAISEISADEFEITLSSNVLVKNIALSTTDSEGFFNNNYFDIIPGRTYTVLFKGDGKNLDKELVIQNVNDSY